MTPEETVKIIKALSNLPEHDRLSYMKDNKQQSDHPSERYCSFFEANLSKMETRYKELSTLFGDPANFSPGSPNAEELTVARETFKLLKKSSIVVVNDSLANPVEVALEPLLQTKLERMQARLRFLNSKKVKGVTECAAFCEILWDKGYFQNKKADMVETLIAFAKYHFNGMDISKQFISTSQNRKRLKAKERVIKSF